MKESAAFALVWFAIFVALSLSAHAEEDKCLARTGVYLCIGANPPITGDPQKDKCVIAKMALSIAETARAQEGPLVRALAPPPNETHEMIMERLADATARVVHDCSDEDRLEDMVDP